MCSSCHGEPNHGWCAICEENQAATVDRIIAREQGSPSVYTPTTDDIRDSYAADIAHVGAYVEKAGAFDHWLALIIEGAEQRGAVKVGRAILEQKIRDMDPEFGSGM